MNHQDHVQLLREGIPGPGGVWADLGAGAGAFTLALADLIGPTGTIYAIDKNRRSLEQLQQAMKAHFPATTLHCIQADFTQPLALPPLHGIVMANSLHYIRQKDGVLQRVRGYLRPDGRLLMVEYNADRGNPWVPYPFSYGTWETLAKRNGFGETRLLERRPSHFLNEMYAAVSVRKEE
jgi:ubiquinone/menaquinone biosynthesis C-methylase UbiE